METKDINFQDLSLDARDIANRINSLITLIVNANPAREDADTERLYGKIRYYWFVAETLGTANKVSETLRSLSGCS